MNIKYEWEESGGKAGLEWDFKSEFIRTKTDRHGCLLLHGKEVAGANGGKNNGGHHPGGDRDENSTNNSLGCLQHKHAHSQGNQE